MLFYGIIFGILAFLSFTELFCVFQNKTKRLIVKIVSLIFVFFSTFYYGPMGDYYTYEKYFKSTNLSHIINIGSNRFEYGYELISSILRIFTNDYTLLRFVLAIIVMTLWYYIYFYRDNFLEKDQHFSMTIMFIVWALNFGNIFIIRSTVAVSICLYSIRFIAKNQLKKFLLSILIACLFHSISILWIPSYFLFKRNHLRKIYYILIGITMLVSSYIPEFVLKVASILGSSAYNAVYSYLSYGRGQQFGSNYDVGFMLFKALINIIFLLLLFTYIVYRKKKIGTLYNEEHFLNLYIIGSYIYIIALFSSTALTRAALTYNSVQYYMLPKIFDLPEFSRNKKTKLIIFILLVIYLFIRMRMNIYSSDYIPFKLQ